MIFPRLITLGLGSVLVASTLSEPLRINFYNNWPSYDRQQAPVSPFDFDREGSQSLDDNHLITKGKDQTIYQTLNQHPHFSCLVKLINFSDEVVNLLNDTSAGITFFAVPDFALKRHHRKHPQQSETTAQPLEDSFAAPADLSQYDLAELLSELDEFEASVDEPDKKRRKKFLKRVIKAILTYHIIPQGLDATALARNLTHATQLTLPSSLDGQPQRVRVQHMLIPPTLKINLISKIIKPDIKATNGIIHVINHPLLTAAIFQELFLVPDFFSFATSALQRVGLTEALDLRWVSDDDAGKSRLEGASAVTFFAPTNHAFKSLPKRLQLFLFSPFGKRALKKLLQFHIVPRLVVHSDYFHNATAKASDNNFVCETQASEIPDSELLFDHLQCDYSGEYVFGAKGEVESGQNNRQDEWGGGECFDFEGCEDFDGPRCPRPHSPMSIPDKPRRRPQRAPIYQANLTLPTLLTNHSLAVHIAKYKFRHPVPVPNIPERYVTRVFVNGQSVAFSDVVARNGAIHVINKVLNPRPGRHPPPGSIEDSWDDWETWLTRWGEE